MLKNLLFKLKFQAKKQKYKRSKQCFDQIKFWSDKISTRSKYQPNKVTTQKKFQPKINLAQV